MSPYTFTRQSWQNPAQPVTGPAINWATITTVVIHYTASRDCPEGAPVEPYKQFLRNMQADYLTSPVRGYSLGYSVAVSTVGQSWEIRGVDIKPAATRGYNDVTYAILVTVDGDNAASPAAVTEVRRLVADAERRAGRPLTIKGHGDLLPTSCPGVGIRAQITAGVFRPVPVPPTPTPEDTDMQAATLWRDSRYLNVFLIGSAPAQNVSPLVYADLVKRGVPVIVETHAQLLETCLFQSGLKATDLVPA